MQKLIDILNMSIDYLEKYKIDSPRLTAQYILGNVLEMKPMELYQNFDKPIKKEEIDKIRKNLIRRAKDREPFQYILGYEEFYGYKFEVDRNVLIPRPETELLVELVLKKIENIESPKILDIGCGSGAIGITIALEREDSVVLGVDISEKALEISEKNKNNNNVKNIKFMQSDIFSNVKYNEFDVIISNPPYIIEEDYKNLMLEVKHEPKLALVAEDNGYYFYKKITENANYFLKNGGILVFELGIGQDEIVKKYMLENNFSNILIEKDYEKINRIILGEKNVKSI